MDLEKDFKGLKDREFEDRNIKFRREIEELFLNQLRHL